MLYHKAYEFSRPQAIVTYVVAYFFAFIASLFIAAYIAEDSDIQLVLALFLWFTSLYLVYRFSVWVATRSVVVGVDEFNLVIKDNWHQYIVDEIPLRDIGTIDSMNRFGRLYRVTVSTKAGRKIKFYSGLTAMSKSTDIGQLFDELRQALDTEERLIPMDMPLIKPIKTGACRQMTAAGVTFSWLFVLSYLFFSFMLYEIIDDWTTTERGKIMSGIAIAGQALLVTRFLFYLFTRYYDVKVYCDKVVITQLRHVIFNTRKYVFAYDDISFLDLRWSDNGRVFLHMKCAVRRQFWCVECGQYSGRRKRRDYQFTDMLVIAVAEYALANSTSVQLHVDDRLYKNIDAEDVNRLLELLT